MNIFCKRYIILSLLILIHNFVFNFAESQRNESKIRTNVLLNFLKVPWVNLNSPWEGAVVPACRDDITTLYQSAEAGEIWALRMLDASSKIPAGILTGNIRDLGMYDECVRMKDYDHPETIQAQHCTVSFSMPTKFFGNISDIMLIQKISIYNPSADVDLSLTASICLPSSCTKEDINGLVTASIASTPELHAFEVGIARVQCSDGGLSTELTLGTLLTILSFAVITIILVSCTVCDFVLRARSGEGSTALKIAVKFSLYTNTIKLWSPKLNSETLPAIHGLRFLNLLLIMFAHRSLTTIIEPMINISDIVGMRHSAEYSIIFSLPFVVDTFFVIGGFLTSLLLLKRLGLKVKVNIFVVYLYRYLRLTPSIAILILFTVFIIPLIGNGPNWKSVYDYSVVFCEKNWWSTLLHIQNFVNVDEMCLLHTWYVATDMQLFCFSSIILYPLFYRPKFGMVILASFLVASFFAPALQLFLNNWSFFLNLNERVPVIYHQFFHSYPLTYNRALPYLIGLLLGYDVLYNKRQFTKFQAGLNWILASSVILFCFWSFHYVQPNAITFDIVWEVIYVSIERLLWSSAMAWIIYACTQGYGGPITKFLSLPVFVPLSRLSYGIYLVHIVLQVTVIATERTAKFFTPFDVTYMVWGDLVLSTMLAFFLCLFFESPVIALMKILLSGSLPENTREASTKKQTTLSAKLETYLLLDSTRGHAHSGFVIETITSQQEFWETVSDELNASSKGPLRSPAEWSKRWQDWKFEVIRIESTWEFHSRGISNGKIQSHAGVATLEKELMLFLAASNHGFADDTRHEASRIPPSKYQSDIFNRKQGNSIRLSIPELDQFNEKKSKFSGSVSTDVESENSRL